MYKIKNVTSGAVAADFVYLMAGQSQDYPYVTTEVMAAKAAGLLTITPDPSAVAPSPVVVLTYNGGGTSGGDTVAAITADPTAQNAFATLAAKLNSVITAVNSISGASGDSNTNVIANVALENSRLV